MTDVPISHLNDGRGAPQYLRRSWRLELEFLSDDY